MKLAKYIFLVILSVITLLGAVACSNSSNNNQYQTVETTTPNENYVPREIKEIYTYEVRTSEATIKDDGRQKNKMDHVPLSDDFSIKDLKNAGYTSLKVTVTFEVIEENDGYQYVFLYKDTSCNSKIVNSIASIAGLNDSSLIYTHKFEYGPGKLKDKWGVEKFTATIKISKLVDDLYIRYGASGDSKDDWRNRKVVVEVVPS